jgi:hypothetical protein
MIVVIDEGLDPSFEITGQIVVLEQDPVFQRLMPAFDLSLGLRVMRRSTDMGHVSLVEPGGEIAGDMAETVVGQESRPVNHGRPVAA